MMRGGYRRSIKSVTIHRAALWILGEYTQSAKDILAVFDLLKQSLGPVSILYIFLNCIKLARVFVYGFVERWSCHSGYFFCLNISNLN